MEGINMLEVIFPISVSFPRPSAAEQKALAPFALEEQRPLRVWRFKKKQILFHIQHRVDVDIKSSVEDFRAEMIKLSLFWLLLTVWKLHRADGPHSDVQLFNPGEETEWMRSAEG